MSFRHEQREAWTLGKDDLKKVVSISGAGWTIVGVLARVDVDRSVVEAARNRFSRSGSAYLAVAVWVGPFVGTIPARAVVLVESVVEDELEDQPKLPAPKKALPGPDVVHEGVVL